MSETNRAANAAANAAAITAATEWLRRVSQARQKLGGDALQTLRPLYDDYIADLSVQLFLVKEGKEEVFVEVPAESVLADYLNKAAMVGLAQGLREEVLIPSSWQTLMRATVNRTSRQTIELALVVCGA